MSFVVPICFGSNKLGLSIRLRIFGNKLLRWLGLLYGLEYRPEAIASADGLREAIPLEVSLRELGDRYGVIGLSDTQKVLQPLVCATGWHDQF